MERMAERLHDIHKTMKIIEGMHMAEKREPRLYPSLETIEQQTGPSSINLGNEKW